MQQFAAREIGARIAQARREQGGMTQEQLAELLNVSTRSVQDYEGGTTIPWRHFQRLEEIFNRRMGWFLHGDVGASSADGGATETILDELRALDRKFDVADLDQRLKLMEETLRRVERRLEEGSPAR